MYNSSNGLITQESRTSVTDLALKRKYDSSIASHWLLIRASVFGLIALLIYLHLSSYDVGPIPVRLPRLQWHFEFGCCIVLFFNSVMNFATYVYPYFQIACNGKIYITDNQKRLLGITDKDYGFGLSPPTKKRSYLNLNEESPRSFVMRPLARSSPPMNSWQNSFWSPNLSTAASSWVYQPQLDTSFQPNLSNSSLSPIVPLNTSNLQSNVLSSTAQNASNLNCSDSFKVSDYELKQLFSFSPSISVSNMDDYIPSPLSLSLLRKRNEKWMKSFDDSLCASGSAKSSPSRSFYTYELSPSYSFNNSGYQTSLTGPDMKVRYQVATPSPQLSFDLGGNNSSKKPSSVSTVGRVVTVLEMCEAAGIQRVELFDWTASLRRWISQTILARLSSEITSINAKLREMGEGLNPPQIGRSSLETLRQIAQTKCSHVPTLAMMLPYLELASDTALNYVVERIQKLAEGSCLADYNGQDSVLTASPPAFKINSTPSDVAIVLHLFCCYMDSKMPYKSNVIERKSFKEKYVIHLNDLPNKLDDDALALCQSTDNPLHYDFIGSGKITSVASGPNNLFFALLLFLRYVRVKENGMLERAHLGPQGINVLYVLDSPTSGGALNKSGTSTPGSSN